MISNAPKFCCKIIKKVQNFDEIEKLKIDQNGVV